MDSVIVILIKNCTRLCLIQTRSIVGVGHARESRPRNAPTTECIVLNQNYCKTVVIIIPFGDWEKNPHLQAVVVHFVGKQVIFAFSSPGCLKAPASNHAQKEKTDGRLRL